MQYESICKIADETLINKRIGCAKNVTNLSIKTALSVD